MNKTTRIVEPDWQGLFRFAIAKSKESKESKQDFITEMLEFGLRLHQHHEEHHDAEINPHLYEAFTPHHHD
jgi:hypothetical protein